MYEAELSFAKSLADKARAIGLKYYKTDLAVVTKADDSPVTIADQLINEMVITAVRETFPDHGILGEEESWQTDRTMLWVCDPIDGTVAFTIGESTFMFSLALVEDGQPVLAVTGDIVTSDIFWAVKGQGAFVNDRRITVSDRRLDESWLAFPTNIRVLSTFQNLYLRLDEEAYQTVMIHGMVFKGMLIAQGLCDGAIWPYSVKPWDAAAVKLIVEEAGGRVTDLNGDQPMFNDVIPGGLIISNKAVYNPIKAIVNSM